MSALLLKVPPAQPVVQLTLRLPEVSSKRGQFEPAVAVGEATDAANISVPVVPVEVWPAKASEVGCRAEVEAPVGKETVPETLLTFQVPAWFTAPIVAAPAGIELVIPPTAAFKREITEPEPEVQAASALVPSVTSQPSTPEPAAKAPEA